MTSTFTGCVFIGTSVDGFIARLDGDLDWLISRGEAAGDYGYDEFIAGIDTVVMGRASYETILGFGPDMWAQQYRGRHVAVVSTTLDTDTDSRISVHRDLDSVVKDLTDRGAKRVYVDGGKLIQSFLRAGLIQEITISQVPVLIGTGIPLFGALDADISLTTQSTKLLGAGLVQTIYSTDA